MSLSKVVTAALMSASVAAGSFLPLASAANAADWNGNRGHGIEHRQIGGERAYRHGGNRAYQDYGYRRHRNNTGRDLAIGVFATALGLALAAEASRVHDDYYGGRD